MTNEQKQNIQTEIDGIEIGLANASVEIRMVQERLNDLKNLLEDKPLDEF